LAFAPLWLAFSAPSAPAAALRTQVSVGQTRCFESELIDVELRLDADASVNISAELQPAQGFSVVGDATQHLPAVRGGNLSWQVRAEHWGRHPVGRIVVVAHDAGLLRSQRSVVDASTVTVFPEAESLLHLPLPRTLPNRLGDHVSRAVGDGTQFAGIRPMVAGDSLRRMNWRATARFRRPFVTVFNAERSSELVVIVDGFSEPSMPRLELLDRCVRATAALTNSYLRNHDRVGVVVLGGVVHWVSGQTGALQFYRVIEELLSVQEFDSAVNPDLDRLPPAVLPAGSLVALATPLLDARTTALVHDLRQRRFPVVVVDVLGTEPPASLTTDSSALAQRMWRLERHAQRAELADVGAHVVDWRGDASLDAALASLPVAGRIA
jgi:uncharacterized protein (DUF58 family)